MRFLTDVNAAEVKLSFNFIDNALSLNVMKSVEH